MSCNTPCPSKNRRLWLQQCMAQPMALGLLAMGMPLATGANTSSAPPSNAPHHELAGSRMLGQYTLRFIGLRIYEARLWAPPDFDLHQLGQQPIVLELQYLRALKGPLIAERSLKEMRLGGRFSDEQGDSWLRAMEAAFPDVSSGDRITGVLMPGVGARFLWNDRPTGIINDPLFATLFFGIWLGPNTSQPAMRSALLANL